MVDDRFYGTRTERAIIYNSFARPDRAVLTRVASHRVLDPLLPRPPLEKPHAFYHLCDRRHREVVIVVTDPFFAREAGCQWVGVSWAP